MPEEETTSQSAFWGLDFPSLDFLEYLYKEPIDKVLKGEGYQIGLGTIRRTGVSSLPTGLTNYVRELQNKHKCSLARIQLNAGCFGLSMLVHNEEIHQVVEAYEKRVEQAKTDKDRGSMSLLESNQGGLDYSHKSEHHTAIPHSEVTDRA